MSNFLTINTKEFHITDEKLKELQKPYSDMEKQFTSLIPEMDKVLEKQEITEQLIAKAKVIKNKLVKIRTGSEKIKKQEKEVFLLGGKITQAVFNQAKKTINEKEEKLEKIINHFELIEEQRKKELRLKRIELLNPYEVDNLDSIDLGGMEDNIFEAFLNDSKRKYEEKLKAKKEEEERIKKEKEENERIRLENEKLKKEQEKIKKENENIKKNTIQKVEKNEGIQTPKKELTPRQKEYLVWKKENDGKFDIELKENGKMVLYKKVSEFII